MTNDWWVQPSIKPHLLSLCQYQTIIKETCCESSLWQQCNCVDYIFILLLAANFFSSGIMLWWWLWLLADDFFARGTITEAAGLFQGIELLTWWRPLPTAEVWSVCRLTQVVHFCRYKYYVDRFVLWESLGWVKEGIYSVCHLSPVEFEISGLCGLLMGWDETLWNSLSQRARCDDRDFPSCCCCQRSTSEQQLQLEAIDCHRILTNENEFKIPTILYRLDR